MKILLLFSSLIFSINSTNSVKLFARNTNFGNENNWKENRLPCPGNHLIFPKTIPRVLLGSSESLHMTDINLPINGEIILDNSVMITGAYIESEVHECDSTVSHFIKEQPDFWYNPFNWCDTNTNGSQCLYRPQVEASMVPSADDFVVFPPHSTFYVGFHPTEPRILAKKIFFRNQIYTNSQLFRKRIQRTFARRYTEFVNINSTYPPDIDLQGNRCKKNFCVSNSNLDIDRMKSICQYVICKPLDCHYQVQPKGSCCILCGNVLIVTLIDSSQKSIFEKWLNNLLKNNYYQKKIIFDLLSIDSDRFQITISSITNELQLNSITEEIENKIYKQRNMNGAQFVDWYSRKSLNPSTVQTKSKLGVVLLIVIIIAFLVGLVIIIKHKRPDVILNIQTRLPKLPKLEIPTIKLNFFSSNFPRFRLKEPYDDTLGVSSGVENIELPNTGVEVFFDNPIYVPNINDTNQ